MPSRPRLALIATAAVTLLALSGCAPASADKTAPADDTGASSFPVSIEHAFGDTKIEEAPERVVTLGWGSTDAAIAVGVVPVGMEAQSYGGDENGVLPWVAEALEDLDADTPAIIPSTVEEPAYEDIAEQSPDLILAVYSGITEEQYDLLSEIAPTVAYPDAPWSTPWTDVVTTVGEALGKTAEAETVLNDIAAITAEQAEAHPELAGKTVAAVADFGGKFYVYKGADSRVDFLFDLGLVDAPAVEELSTGDSSFYYELSYEEVDKLESDILVSYSDTAEAESAFLSSSYAKTIPAVASGAVASVVGVELIAAVSPPSALSLTWGLEDYVALLSTAASAVE
ncbi:iron-siderophore ABC transporter substrate-binding protein [Mycetocola manganoxydans]|uniref:Iron-siderophore ABC transporter substrate-binding protein n=1 Tax=Mycetocola manganoxydans TaxID=699879 RepID=A0A3L6ZZD3_9MICO|nr:iron-siderophore ABC transporter substrate-binding protein [Mycetocola manganoxydans]RLP72542.1 iron-siderophore ABC transporter substrate-binding protein [Mycetocola manganoxydans]GHD39805.1 periplasmic binding protein [Mycetocola manganoxydans]